jgi:cysteinyl-tRNA synthetase
MLKIYNTLSRSKETFIPRITGKVSLYVCGMTVYDYCHIGHARVMIVFDMVVRYLRHLDYDVTYVRNITDIDDKIIQRARENNEDFHALTARFIDAMHEDERALYVLPPNIEPRATQHIPSIIEMIEKLIHQNFAYVGTNGDVFYAVNQFATYGQLSGKHLNELHAGERVDVDLAKRNPLDFVLWKMAKPDEPAWNSPWGRGRPGWHIECSAMSTDCLGHTFDIHGGGMDLQFPHHENEIAQSEGATGQKFVNIWMHNGFVRINEEKMSKSLGNFFTVREVLKQYRPEVVRFFILSSHYRSPLNYSDEQLKEAEAALTRLYTALRDLDDNLNSRQNPTNIFQGGWGTCFEEAMNDDFNTPVALSVLFDIAKELNKTKLAKPEKAHSLAFTLKTLANSLGLLQSSAEIFLKGTDSDDLEIETKIQSRIEAKKNKNWVLADQIRHDLKNNGIILEDAPDGTTRWRREL